jgi:hypothetical protein
MLYQLPLLILLLGFTLALESCETVQVQNRTACFVNGQLSLGATCANTVGGPIITQLTTEQALEMLEASPAHPPGVFQSAADYGEETTELEIACRILGNNCSYALQSTIDNHKLILSKLNALQK